MKFTKFLRAVIGANVIIIMAFAFLPALLINPNVDIFQNIVNYISGD
ncbi:hypothetical protein QTL97_09020 [Sporosarcina thermotolerans]|uniref:Uncharacterized protein n=1 Tax=Sporosarcina thermotolerans TaxID=633404 RepID=A0AAW9A9L8_9BACL|nr:hypothetical protein [Sporosarcina thermotolerans]MDW0117075.1 hypothetical protein [Sporosarcina thermotolerans]WHT47828.1 hypothetical protein QNH10_17285 [Sporosarcina thermotolerans]